ncbi:MAG: ATP-binding protein [bacterium]|nr:ATP-binding protein [bacterium]
MIRFASEELDSWLVKPNRKPMVVRGARQVGKTWLVRDFAVRHELKLLELNFERLPALAELFSDNDPMEIMRNIEAELAISIEFNSSLLFLDEIQAAPQLFSKLRWFREELPQLPVIAAGSLLDFALSKHQYSVPVGRITYFHLEPMSFFEFLTAIGNQALGKKLLSTSFKTKLPELLHEKCLNLYYDYCLVGGMPEVVQEWTDSKDIKSCIKIQQDLMATYRDDFHKYGGEIEPELLNRILLSVSEQLGNKFVYSQVDAAKKVAKIKKALMRLDLAKVCTRIQHTAGNGLPLGAESNDKFFKAIMVDIGLISVQMGLSLTSRRESKNIIFSNKGGLAEQFVGQQLRVVQAPSAEPRLYYWQTTGGRQGEIDYIIQHANRVVPVEVKSGATGSLKSLHMFMANKNLDFAVRCNTNQPSLENISVKTTTGEPVSYRLLSIPLYLTERLDGLIEQSLKNTN